MSMREYRTPARARERFGTLGNVAPFVPPPSDWQPSSLSGLILDLDPAFVATTGSLVDTVEDQSSTGNNATSTGANRPSYTAENASYNDKPTIDFTGTTFMDTDLTVSSTPCTMILVGHCLNNTGNRYPIVTSSGAELGIACGAGVWCIYDGYLRASSKSATTPSVVVCVAKGNAAYTNGIFANSLTPELVYNSAVTATDGTRLGNYQAAMSGFGQGGPTARYIVYNRALSNSEVAEALVGLGAIYGITIGA